MNEKFTNIIRSMKANSIAFAVLDADNSSMIVLASPSSKDNIKSLLACQGWKKIKDNKKELYLYGMDRFLYYVQGNQKLTVCFQISCKSTLNGEWIPLDKKINDAALNRVKVEDEYVYLSPEDDLCYVLAKCVYTEKTFAGADVERIERDFTRADINILLPKLEGVFFKFTRILIGMLNRKAFDRVIEELWCFADYEQEGA